MVNTSIERQEINKSVYINSYSGNFKRNLLSINLVSVATRKNITTSSLIPYLLERGSEKYPDLITIRRTLCDLYGSEMSLSMSSRGGERVLSGSIVGISERYLGEDVFVDDKRVDLLLDLIFNPLTYGDGFSETWFNIDKEKHRIRIESEIEDKRDYCLKLLRERFFKGDVRSLPTTGFAEDIDKITPSSLYQAYKEFLKNCKIEVVYVGDKVERVVSRIESFFKFDEISDYITESLPAIKYGEEELIDLKLETQQTKIAMAYTSGRNLTEREKTVFRVVNVILGGSPVSRLFKNLREINGLCYYCSSFPNFNSGSLMIDGGIDSNNINKFRNVVNEEISELASGEIDAKELKNAIDITGKRLKKISDSPVAIIRWILNSVLDKDKIELPLDEFNRIMTVSKQEISTLAELFKIKTTVILNQSDVEGLNV
ncbi:MAG: insulinase family protein [Ruminococcaceae bacterium]|nr:insulinase family protein [Oscillospiraceae bacterium]